MPRPRGASPSRAAEPASIAPEDIEETRRQVRELSEQAGIGEGPAIEAVTTLDQVIQVGDARQLQELRDSYAKRLLFFLGLQMAATNVIFAGYCFGVDWHVPDGVMLGWLGSTVVELVGVVAVVTRSLFPPRLVP